MTWYLVNLDPRVCKKSLPLLLLMLQVLEGQSAMGVNCRW